MGVGVKIDREINISKQVDKSTEKIHLDPHFTDMLKYTLNETELSTIELQFVEGKTLMKNVPAN